MAKRITTKIGEIFSVNINNNIKKYFQLIAFDLTQLNSDVIRAFKKEYPIDADPSLSEIINEEVEFYAHCVTKWGIKLNYWTKVGNINETGNTKNILFRATSDYGVMIDNKPIAISEKWYTWKINKPFKDVGKLEGENRKAEIGIVMDGESIVHRMKTGEYDGFYPGFE